MPHHLFKLFPRTLCIQGDKILGIDLGPGRINRKENVVIEVNRQECGNRPSVRDGDKNVSCDGSREMAVIASAAVCTTYMLPSFSAPYINVPLHQRPCWMLRDTMLRLAAPGKLGNVWTPLPFRFVFIWYAGGSARATAVRFNAEPKMVVVAVKGTCAAGTPLEIAAMNGFNFVPADIAANCIPDNHMSSPMYLR